MAQIIIRGIPDEIHRAIKERARARGRSVEALLCELLEQNFGPEQPGFGDQLAAIWRGADLESIRLERDRSPYKPPAVG